MISNPTLQLLQNTRVSSRRSKKKNYFDDFPGLIANAVLKRLTNRTFQREILFEFYFQTSCLIKVCFQTLTSACNRTDSVSKRRKKWKFKVITQAHATKARIPPAESGPDGKIPPAPGTNQIAGFVEFRPFTH